MSSCCVVYTPFSLLFGCGLFICCSPPIDQLANGSPLRSLFTLARLKSSFSFSAWTDLLFIPSLWVFIHTKIDQIKSPFSSSLPSLLSLRNLSFLSLLSSLGPLFFCFFVHFPSLFLHSPLQLTTILFSPLLIPPFVCCINSTLSHTNYIPRPPCQPLKNST